MRDNTSSRGMPGRRAAAIACGGTGGHLFPGIAVGEELRLRGWDITLLISTKEVDRQGVASVSGMRVETLPAVGLSLGGLPGFAAGFVKSMRKSRALFKAIRPDVVLAMGGFTSAPPFVAGRLRGARTFLHEANTIPGRANRWLARLAEHAFVYFPETAPRLRSRLVEISGMPVRPQFLKGIDSGAARAGFGLDPDTPTLLVMGGSQGASAINEMVIAALPRFGEAGLQVLHITGARDFDKVKSACESQRCRVVARPFLAEMELALGAATVAVTRAGASSLAELAAMRVPSVLIPYPTAADNHQYFNARAFARDGAAEMIEQKSATADGLASSLIELVRNESRRAEMRRALGAWHKSDAASVIAEQIVRAVEKAGPK